ncbi:hypothetical protein Tco_0478389 [Tanacetum coccineum]
MMLILKTESWTQDAKHNPSQLFKFTLKRNLYHLSRRRYHVTLIVISLEMVNIEIGSCQSIRVILKYHSEDGNLLEPHQQGLLGSVVCFVTFQIMELSKHGESNTFVLVVLRFELEPCQEIL